MGNNKQQQRHPRHPHTPTPHARPQYTTQLQLCVASSYLAPCVLLGLVTMSSSCMQCQASEGKGKRWTSSCSDAQACACGGTTQGRGHCGTRAEGRCPLYRAASKKHTPQVHARASVLDSPTPHTQGQAPHRMLPHTCLKHPLQLWAPCQQHQHHHHQQRYGGRAAAQRQRPAPYFPIQ